MSVRILQRIFLLALVLVWFWIVFIWTVSLHRVPRDDSESQTTSESFVLPAAVLQSKSGGPASSVGADGPHGLTTEWGQQVLKEPVAWPEYPRPDLVREQWLNLNGFWDYAITKAAAESPEAWDGQIRVPFALESPLSGVERLLGSGEALWYRRSFEHSPLEGQLLILNFEAVDFHCKVWVNDRFVGHHTGGNTPFQFDISAAAQNGTNTLRVSVTDDTSGSQLKGNQPLKPRGMWYTRVSGIWQTVWIESVSKFRIQRLQVVTVSAQKGLVEVTPFIALEGLVFDGKLDLQVDIEVTTSSYKVVARESWRIDQRQQWTGRMGPLDLVIPEPLLWTLESPHLYTLNVWLKDVTNGEWFEKTLDRVTSYIGLREVGRARDAAGHLRFTLNGEEIFHFGTLDQGWWPDGLLTPPSDQAMLSDINFLKSAGFNTIRKHIKVEPRRYYYHCDRVGMLVWQDHVAGGAGDPRLSPRLWDASLSPTRPEDGQWTDSEHRQFQLELESMVDVLYNHPSLVVWVLFNEAWGQHMTADLAKWTMARDPARLVDAASGGNFWPVGHIADAHHYPEPLFPFDAERFDEAFIKVVGEFGGHGWPIPSHTWTDNNNNRNNKNNNNNNNNNNNWDHGGVVQQKDVLLARYNSSMLALAELRVKGVAGGIYTQTTDVETEVNGLLTYDRRKPKLSIDELRQIHKQFGFIKQ
ncbi:unnamed protein product [Polarella glacialis]|uniref:Beta-galactosidase n=1 Tax=Polarella glacialis TaxID=89957 RepID=A0A813GNQ7_POLGL|nr:unnamed protein product [Polarella glacialis]CAE8642140.1 unnamed protein product [Polarella glacialis]